MSRDAHQSESDHGRERLLDLLSQRATEGLSPAEEIEVARLLTMYPDVDEMGLELAAAAATLALLDAEGELAQPLPDHLRQRTRRLAGLPASGAAAAVSARPRLVGDDDAAPAPTSRSSAAPNPRVFRLGWLAAAAALVLAAVGWWRALAPAASVPATPASLVSEYQKFTESATDLVRCPWMGKEPGFEGVRGQVVWSDQQQRGYMLLSGLRINDPTREQYQLWIVDPSRDKNPVDGGVFNIAAAAEGNCTTAGEVIVPIDCKLPVSQPVAFALTVEKPGGVVVSAGPLVAVAAR